MGGFGDPGFDIVAGLRSERTTAWEATPLYGVVGGGRGIFGLLLGVEPSHVEMYSKCTAQGVFEGESGTIRSTTGWGTLARYWRTS